jgi:phosphoglycolate phosphatase-like HAD superfamily hydrolase
MSLQLSRVRALCFDIDGTLSDTDDQFVRRLAGWLRPFRGLFPQGNVLPAARRLVMATEAPGNFLVGIPDRLGVDEPLAKLGDWVYHLGLGRGSRQFLLIPQADETLLALKDQFPLSVVSARGERTARLFLDQFDLTRHFRCIAAAQTCRHTKPFPDPILWAAREMGVAPEECLMIGDTTIDIRAGRAAGAQTVGVLSGFGDAEELHRCGADVILCSVAELPSLLLGR